MRLWQHGAPEPAASANKVRPNHSSPLLFTINGLLQSFESSEGPYPLTLSIMRLWQHGAPEPAASANKVRPNHSSPLLFTINGLLQSFESSEGPYPLTLSIMRLWQHGAPEPAASANKVRPNHSNPLLFTLNGLLQSFEGSEGPYPLTLSKANPGTFDGRGSKCNLYKAETKKSFLIILQSLMQIIRFCEIIFHFVCKVFFSNTQDKVLKTLPKFQQCLATHNQVKSWRALFSLPLSLVGLHTQKTKNDGPSLEYLQRENCDFLINLVYAVFIS